MEEFNYHIHQQPQAGGALHHRRRVPDPGRSAHGRSLHRQGGRYHGRADLADLCRQHERVRALDWQRQPQYSAEWQYPLVLVAQDRCDRRRHRRDPQDQQSTPG